MTLRNVRRSSRPKAERLLNSSCGNCLRIVRFTPQIQAEPVRHLSMKPADRLSLAYARFISFSASVRQLTGSVALDPAEERVLQCLAVAWSLDHPLTVLEAMALPHGLSQSTAHRRLTLLRKKGFMVLKSDDKDARVRYVEPTERAQRYFSQLGRCLMEALKETSTPPRGA